MKGLKSYYEWNKYNYMPGTLKCLPPTSIDSSVSLNWWPFYLLFWLIVFPIMAMWVMICNLTLIWRKVGLVVTSFVEYTLYWAVGGLEKTKDVR